MYGKLFASLYDGTLATKGPWQAIVAFQQFIALADAAGHVDMTAEAISRRTTIPLRIIRIGIAALEQPDPDSRTPDEEGRRIVRLSDTRDWGWRIVNHEHYRKLRSTEERREYMKQYQREHRSTKSTERQQLLTPVNNVTDAVSSTQYAVDSKQLTPKPPNGGGRLQAAELLKDVRVLVSPMHPNSLEKDWTKHFSEGQLRVIRAVGTERILSTRPENDGPLLAQVAQMLAEVA